jgi:hypothetical protein
MTIRFDVIVRFTSRHPSAIELMAVRQADASLSLTFALPRANPRYFGAIVDFDA